MSAKLTRAVTAAAAGAVSVLLLTAAPASAAWTAIQTVSPPNWSGQDQPTVAIDRQGDALLAWAGCDGNVAGCTDQVQAQVRTQAGAVTPIQVVSEPGRSASWPKVAVDDDGDAAVVWVQDSVIAGARVSAVGVAGPPQLITARSSISPSVAVNRSGSALVTWTESVGSHYVAKARRFGVDGTLGPELTLGAGGVDGPAVAFADDGTALVVWTEDYDRIVSIRIGADDGVSDRTQIAPPATEVRYGQIATTVDADGDAVLTYRITSYSGDARLVLQRYSRHGVLEQAVVATPETHWLTFYSSVVTGHDGTSVLVWGRWNWDTDNSREVYLRRFPATGTPGEVTLLGRGDWPSIALDDTGAGLVAWQYPGPMVQTSQVRAVTLAVDGTHAPVETITPDGRTVTVAASPTGNLAVVWQKGSHPSAIQARFTG